MQLILGIMLSFILGIIINYLSDMLPIAKRLSRPICTQCKKPLRWSEYLMMKNCPSCGKPKPIRAWVVILAMIGFSVLFWFFPISRLGYLISLILTAYFAVIFVIDIEHRLIFIWICIFGGVGAIPLGIWLRYSNLQIQSTFLQSVGLTLLGGIAGFLIMLGIYYLGVLFNRIISRLRKTPLEEEAFGYGDVLVSAVIGLILGWPGILAAVLLTILLGGIFSGIYIAFKSVKKKYQAFTAIPYAPFLLISTIILLYLAK
jgi:prepilin signal peptidase PulO-like enzyme (type II secretory pathway)